MRFVIFISEIKTHYIGLKLKWMDLLWILFVYRNIFSVQLENAKSNTVKQEM